MSRRAKMILDVIGGTFGIIFRMFVVMVGGIGGAFDVSGASTVSSLGLGAVILGV